MNSLTMLGQLQSFYAASQKLAGIPEQNRTTHEEAELLREAIVEFINSRKRPVEIKDIRKDLEISESSARVHLGILERSGRIVRLSTRPMSWTRREE